MIIANVCVCCGNSDLQRDPAMLMPFVAQRIFDWKPFMIFGLRDVPNGMAYALCSTLRCNQCGLMFLDMRFNNDEMRRLYRDYRGKEYTELRDSHEPGYTFRNQRLIHENHKGIVEEFLTVGNIPRSILDYGGGDGTKTPFTSRAQICDVYDIGDGPVLTGNKVQLLEGQYDLVVCAHVLEHVPQPQVCLYEIRQVMHTESMLYIELPLEDMGPKHHWHEHINFFTKASLYCLLERSGFEVIAYRETNVNSSNLIMLTARRVA